MGKILVTGGTGYIGAHTVVELHREGYEVLIVDNLSNSNIKILDQLQLITGKRFDFVQMDLQDIKAVRQLAKLHHNITGIIHFAASKAVGESVQEPLKYYHNNLGGLLNLLTVFDKEINFVFSSSCTVYGQPDRLPVTEKDPVKSAESPYGNTKQIAEEILRDAAQANVNLNVVCLRYFNPVGAIDSALIGELPLGVPANLVPYITQSAIGKRGPIVVHGNDYDTADGSAVRDYIHVVDLAKAHVSAIKRLEKKAAKERYEIFNIGTGKGYSVLEVIAAFKKTTQQKLDYKIGPRRAGDIAKIYGDVTKAEQVLGWKAKLGIEEMMASAWKWEKYVKANPFE
ncbi:UDP-glucose 4-epimerase GalE [Pedobacter sp. SL55]|uniref:UDP-glucose 4-epimerase GalE n=1 Tax=Pedobacter sp. SL55 TaxID=2995161 RepID=UPI00226F3782|nr:UDP-glucose 4-epimerase GalE [Pedobacter sp. SL55]WAC39803.1 UDP-glucose 4-epimerase GalE [Pedobacter sp. SL55]